MKSAVALIFLVALSIFIAGGEGAVFWARFHKKSCQRYNGKCIRAWSSVLRNIPWGRSPYRTCQVTKATVPVGTPWYNKYAVHPTWCVGGTSRGIWIVPDNFCVGKC